MKISGRVGFEGDVERVPSLAGDATGGLHIAGTIAVKEGSFQTADGKWGMSKIGVNASIDHGQLNIIDASGEWTEGLRLSAAGNIDVWNQKGTLNLGAAGDDVALPAEARRGVSAGGAQRVAGI